MKYAQIAWTLVICSLYMVVGPSLVVLNRHILKEGGFPYPMLLSSLGLCFSALTAHTLAAVGAITVGKQGVVTRRFWLNRVVPVGACHAATLAFGNAQYLHMGVALVQFLKAFTPIVVTAVVSQQEMSELKPVSPLKIDAMSWTLPTDHVLGSVPYAYVPSVALLDAIHAGTAVASAALSAKM